MTTILNPAALAAKSNEAKAMHSAEKNVTSAFAETLQASAAEDTGLEHVPAPTAPTPTAETAPSHPIADPASYAAPAAPQVAPQPVFTPQPAQTPATSLPGLPGGTVSPQRAAMIQVSENASVTVVLSVPVEISGILVTEVDLREPNFGDWMDCGNLMDTIALDVENTEGGRKVQFQTNLLNASKWFARLSGMNRINLRKLNMKDAKRVIEAMQKLVGDDDTENPQN